MEHDQLFKELLPYFFAEFLELFCPDVAARLDFTDVVFLDKDLYTDFPRGRQREPDLVARVDTTTGEPEIIVVHVEVQARRARDFGARMAEYYMLLRLRHQIPVFPVVLYLERGAGGIGVDQYQESVFDRPVMTFDYCRIGVPDLVADEYLQSDNPLAYGLAALMQPGSRGRVETKAECLLRIARAVLDEAQKLMLANCVETYLRLDEHEQLRFEQIVGAPVYEEVTRMLSVYEERGIVKGEVRGRVQGKRDAALRQMRHKFGELPDAVRGQVQEIESEAELDDLLDAILDSVSLDDLGLMARGRNGHAA